MGTCQELVVRGIGNACYGPPLTFSPGMDPVEWLESMEDFFVVTGVPSSQQAASAGLSVNIAVRRKLFPPGSPRDISWDELKRRFLDIYGHGESLIQLASIREFAQEVAELGCRAGKSENGLVARFICGVASKEVHRELRLREPTTLVKAHQLAENAAELETEVGEVGCNADAGNDNLAQAVEALTRRETECFRCGEQGHFRRDCPQLQTRTRPARALNSGNGVCRLLAMTELQAGHAPSVAGKLNGLEISLLLDSGAKPPEAPSCSATGEECASAARGRCRWRGRIHVAVVESLVEPGILGTNFHDQYVKLIDWQAGEMTMTDGSRVRIIHEPASSTRPGEGPENDSDELGACERALMDRAEYSARNQRTRRSLPRSPAEVPMGAVKLDAANPIKQWQESDKELQQIREWSTQRTWPQAAPEGSRLLRSL
ncbi:hypothetical protein T09_2105 [Trichinella sp. T9]|nr:hypothetical protein T09_2105 [Trichinella sp. T9]